MKAMNRISCMAGGLLLLSGAAGTVQGDIMVGDTTDLTFLGASSARSVAWTFDGDSGTTNAGILDWAGGYRTFCVQLEENIGGAITVPFAVVAPDGLPDEPPLPGPMGSVRSLVMQDLFSRYYDSVMTGTADDAAAFQMVIWEISHEMDADATDAASLVLDLDFASDSATFSSIGAVDTIAQSMLDSLGSGGFMRYSQLLGLTSDEYQDQLIVVPGAGAIAGLVGVAGIRARRRRD